MQSSEKPSVPHVTVVLVGYMWVTVLLASLRDVSQIMLSFTTTKCQGCVNARGCDPFSYMQAGDNRGTETLCASGNMITSLSALFIYCHSSNLYSTFVNVED